MSVGMSVSIENLRHEGSGIGSWKIKEVVLDCKQGDIVTIEGESGIGKTTILKYFMFPERFEVESGSLVYSIEEDGTTNEYKPAEIRDRKLITYIGTEHPFVNHQSISESIRMFGEFVGVERYSSNCLNNEELELWGLNIDLLEKKPHELSYGQRRRFSMLAMLALSPKIILIDEVFRGLDAETRKRVLERLTQYKDDNDAIFIISTHAVEVFNNTQTMRLKITASADDCAILNKVLNEAEEA